MNTSIANTNRRRSSRLSKNLMLQLVLLLLVSVGTALALPTGQFKGTVTLNFLAAKQTNNYSFALLTSSTNWDLTLHNADRPNIVQELLCSGTQTLWINHFLDYQNSKKKNSGDIRVFPGSRPFMAPGAEHIWFALLSGTNFKDGKVPFRDPGLCISEPCIITKMDATPDESGPHEMEWHNERNDKYSTESRLEGHYKQLASLTLPDGQKIPSVSTLEIDMKKPGSDDVAISLSELHIEEFSPIESTIDSDPVLSGRNVITDYRPSDIWEKKSVFYNVSDKKLPLSSSPFVQNAYRSKYPYLAAAKSRPVAFWICIAILVVPGLAILLIQIKKQKHIRQHKQ